VIVLLAIVLAALGVARVAVRAAVSLAVTPTGYFYPLGSATYYQARQGGNCGWWLSRSSPYGCYPLTGNYHLGFDMWNQNTVVGTPVFAHSTGTVIQIQTSLWGATNGVNNKAIFTSNRSANGAPFVALYGHLLSSSVKVHVGDVVTAGTQIATVGYWPSADHVHLGIWPNYSSMPPGPHAIAANSAYPNTYGTADPSTWITSSGSAPKCQNGGTVYYLPNGQTPVHPNGTLFTVKNDPWNAPGTVYVLYKGSARPISSASVLWQLYGAGRGFDFRDVIQISLSEALKYAPGYVVNSPLPSNGRNAPDGRLIQQWGGSEISIVSDGKRRPFASPDALLNLGYQFCNVAGVSDYWSYPVGQAITQ